MKCHLILVLSIAAAAAATAFEKCERKWKKVGCYQDFIDPERPLTLELVNRRDPSNPNWDGHMIDWNAYPGTLHALYCKCAELTEKKGYSQFGLQFYGECWSGPSAETRYSMQGSSDRCIGIDYKSCDDKAVTECVGKDSTNYIYQLVSNGTNKVTDGGFTEWGSWSKCSKSCGGGFTQRERWCTNPSPSKGGEDCSSLGDTEEVASCGNGPCKKTCNKAIELGIILDASSSVGYFNYIKVKEFVEKLSEDFTISTAGTHFGMMHYSGSPRLDFVPNDSRYHERPALKAKIHSIIYSYGGTRTDLALRMAEKSFFCSSCTRAGKPKVLLVITDGNTNEGSEDLAVASQKMKNDRVTILSVGIGSQISLSELQTIASEPKAKHVFKLDSFDALKGKLDDIMEMACASTK